MTISTPDGPINRAEEIFCAALDIESGAERNAFIEKSCDGDAALRREVDLFLSALEQSEDYFDDERPTEITASEIANALTHIPDFFENMKGILPDDDEIGKQIGHYKLLQKIGEGGVGNVYLAEQSKPVRRQVALKIIKAGMDTKNVIARFEAERQALALMEHPNIARVLNAGETETGRPYFVMELVHGERITTYFDKNGLNLHQRLALFVQVCYAIQHAHQKGIIHRDIKPSNVLITQHNGAPSPVVIDFGIAKATEEDLLTEKTLNTSMGPIIGTPVYMSPEQADSAHTDIDTRSDIYSLGALLYELLTRQPPFNSKELLKSGLAEMARILRVCEPPPPSVRVLESEGVDARKLSALLEGDMDGIVMMAMEKDRNRRYQTAAALAEDVVRYLNNEPVIARMPSRLYRLQKLVRRNKTTFIYLSLVAAALISGFGTSTVLLLRERKVRKQAVRAEQRAVEAQHKQERLLLEAQDREQIAHAAFLISNDQMEEADQAVETVTTEQMPSLELESVLRTLGEWHSLHGRWDKAVDRFKLLLQVDIKDDSWAITGDLLRAGPVLIERGDTQGYDKFRQASIARYEGVEDPVFAERTLKISLLLPANEQMMEQLKPFAEIAAQASQSRILDNMTAWRCMSLSLMAYRQHDAAASIFWCERSRSFRSAPNARTATTHVIQAMAHQRRNEPELAIQELQLGRTMIENQFRAGLQMGDADSGFLYDWLFARILLREAESLIK